MKKILNQVLFTTLIAVAMTAFGQAEKDPSPSAEKEVRDLVSKIEAALNRADKAFVERLMSPTYFETDPQGRIISRAEMLQALAQPLPEGMQQSWQFSEVQVFLNGDTAIANYRVTFRAKFKEKEQVMHFRTTDVYVRRKGEWVLLTAHNSTISPSPTTAK